MVSGELEAPCYRGGNRNSTALKLRSGHAATKQDRT